MLKKLCVAGFTSIREQSITFDNLNVLIGANGAGKSNLLAFFEMIAYLSTGGLEKFVGEHGYASSLLHYGPKVSPRIELELTFEIFNGSNGYLAHLSHAAGDILMFTNEEVWFHSPGHDHPKRDSLGAGHRETRLSEACTTNKTACCVHQALKGCKVYHFHDTSAQARIRNHGYIEDNKYLRTDGGNLAAFLYGLKQSRTKCYQRIVDTIRQVAPFFQDFVLEPSYARNEQILLNWHDTESDILFGPHQLSDGTLRAMALITLLLQPQDELPALIVLDEPEIGLHPFAIVVLADLLRQASRHAQIIVSTQSTNLLDQFEPEQIIVAEREHKETIFRRLDPADLEEWLAEYSVSELWEKNVLGGRPRQ